MTKANELLNYIPFEKLLVGDISINISNGYFVSVWLQVQEKGFVIVSMSLLCKRDFVIICKHSCPFNPGSMRVLHVDLGMYLRKYCKYTFTQVVQRAVIDIQVQNIIRRS